MYAQQLFICNNTATCLALQCLLLCPFVAAGQAPSAIPTVSIAWHTV
jgi:hypothetical protein